MESRLHMTAEMLPEPGLDFQAVEGKYKNISRPVRKSRLWLRAAVACVLIICLVTSVYGVGKMKYGLWSGIHSSGYGDVVLLNWKYGVFLPEDLCGLPFSGMSTYFGALEGATHLEALLAPTYALHSISYGEYTGTEQTDGTILWTGKQIDISFGTTEKESWRYHFSVGPDGYCNYEGVTPGSQRTVEYEGLTLYLHTVGERHSARWEDEARKLVMKVSCAGAESQEEVIAIAKELIDLNRNCE